MRLLAVDGSPTGGGRTELVLRAVLDASRSAGAETELVALAERAPGVAEGEFGRVAEADLGRVAEVVARLEHVDGLVLGSPVYRASFAWPLKVLFDHLPRGRWGETSAPLRGKPVATVMTGASLHHFLALNDLRNVLATFFAAHVVPPGLYVPRDGFGVDGGGLTEPYVGQAELTGRALVELAAFLPTTRSLRALEPQA